MGGPKQCLISSNTVDILVLLCGCDKPYVLVATLHLLNSFHTLSLDNSKRKSLVSTHVGRFGVASFFKHSGHFGLALRM